MKLIVQPNGPHQVYAFTPEQHAHPGRPSVVRVSAFMDQHLARKSLILLGQVNDEATDAELVKYLAEAKGDTELALEAFRSAFPVNPQAEAEAETTQPKRGRKRGS